MHPVLFKLGPLTIHTYGVLVAAAFLAAIFLASREATRKGIDPERIMDLGLYVLAAAIVGSRLFEVAVNYEYYLSNPADIFKIWKGGLVFYGGFIGAVATGIWFLRKHGLPVWKVGDIAAPCIALGQSIGRIGCLEAGCCYGKPTDLPWAITFTNPDTLAVMGVPVHPTQVYESLGTFLLFLALFAYRKRIAFDGQLFWLYVLAYSVLRFCLEFLRGDTVRGFVHVAGFDVSTGQAVAIGAFLTAVTMLTRLKAASRRKSAS
ncbi:MAG: prolipoprotein diacylglyceryl transferase [Nitrospirae bacterium]|nr:prolipoprotein diacylglyceryl transferase [Nitrospirota bacterium]